MAGDQVDDVLAPWIGRTEVREGAVTAELVDRMRATLSVGLIPETGVPLGIHWCVALDSADALSLAADGHPSKGGFLPPVPLPNRMWAAGQLTFHDAFRVGDTVRRSSSIESIRFREGRSGPLCFVTIVHDYGTERGTAVVERQEIVYRDAAAAAPASVTAEAVCEVPTGGPITPDAILLFRYSALTFNAHRIHYDLDYATRHEGYPERVVHGPLQATLLMNLAACGRGAPRQFAFRAIRTAFCGNPLWLGESIVDEATNLATVDAIGRPFMTARADW